MPFTLQEQVRFLAKALETKELKKGLSVQLEGSENRGKQLVLTKIYNANEDDAEEVLNYLASISDIPVALHPGVLICE